LALTVAEKIAGRAFVAAAQAELTKSLADDPPIYTVPHFLALYRHACQKRNNRSTALELTEVYVQSPAYDVVPERNLAVPCDEPSLPVSTLGQAFVYVPAGRFGFLYRAGRCRGCGHTARSTVGRLVDGWERPPVHGRVARA
jgi:hypothetical protein